jgi:hypothetical protein
MKIKPWETIITCQSCDREIGEHDPEKLSWHVDSLKNGMINDMSFTCAKCWDEEDGEWEDSEDSAATSLALPPDEEDGEWEDLEE